MLYKTLKIWLKANYPDVAEEYNNYRQSEKRKQQRERAAEIYKLAKEAKLLKESKKPI